MAAQKIGIAAVIGMVVLLLLLAFSNKAVAQSNGCSSVMMTLSPCLDFISSKSTAPGISCCSVLAGVVQSDPRCLCMILDGSAASLGISVNQTRALDLPGVCKVQAPPVSQCKGPQGGLAQTPSGSSDNPATEEEEEADADAPSGNATSTATNSKDTRNLIMASMLIPACTLLYVF